MSRPITYPIRQAWRMPPVDREPAGETRNGTPSYGATASATPPSDAQEKKQEQDQSSNSDPTVNDNAPPVSTGPTPVRSRTRFRSSSVNSPGSLSLHTRRRRNSTPTGYDQTPPPAYIAQAVPVIPLHAPEGQTDVLIRQDEERLRSQVSRQVTKTRTCWEFMKFSGSLVVTLVITLVLLYLTLIIFRYLIGSLGAFFNRRGYF